MSIPSIQGSSMMLFGSPWRMGKPWGGVTPFLNHLHKILGPCMCSMTVSYPHINRFQKPGSGIYTFSGGQEGLGRRDYTHNNWTSPFVVAILTCLGCSTNLSCSVRQRARERDGWDSGHWSFKRVVMGWFGPPPNQLSFPLCIFLLVGKLPVYYLKLHSWKNWGGLSNVAVVRWVDRFRIDHFPTDEVVTGETRCTDDGNVGWHRLEPLTTRCSAGLAICGWRQAARVASCFLYSPPADGCSFICDTHQHSVRTCVTHTKL